MLAARKVKIFSAAPFHEHAISALDLVWMLLVIPRLV